MSLEYESAAEIRGAILALKEEFEGEPTMAESIGVIAAAMVVNGDVLKRILAELTAMNAIQGGK